MRPAPSATLPNRWLHFRIKVPATPPAARAPGSRSGGRDDPPEADPVGRESALSGSNKDVNGAK